MVNIMRKPKKHAFNVRISGDSCVGVGGGKGDL
jgi:hypothetical protein